MRTQTVKTEIAPPSLADFLKACKFGAICACLAAVVLLFLPNYYLSEARILPADTKSPGGLGQLAAAAAAFGVGVPGQDSGDANFIDILGSRSVLEDLLTTEFKFKARSWRFGPETTRKQTLYAYLEAKNMDRGVKQLSQMITLSKDLKSKILTIGVETKSPDLSQQIVRKAIQDLASFVLVKGRTRGGEKARFEEARLEEARTEMAKAENTLRAFLETNRNYQTSPDPETRLKGGRLEAELKLRQQLVMTLAVSYEQALMEEKNDIPIVNILDDANLPIDKSKPGRTLMVVMVFLGTLAGAWAWLNRTWIRGSLFPASSEQGDPVPDN